MPLDRRLAGILLHPTSLPGPFGIGDLGPAAYRFLDWLRDAGMAYWQVLPLGPTSFGDSPYQCFSAFAGNPLLVSPERLMDEGLVDGADLHPPGVRYSPVDYGPVIHWKKALLEKAHNRFAAGGFDGLRVRYAAWTADPGTASWLEDYALFMACKDANEGRAWVTWEHSLRSFQPQAVADARAAHAARIEFHRFAQFLFFDQWNAVRGAARDRGIEIVGDAPIYVAYDSADTWAHQHLFQLDADGAPTHVAGVPPDYFSETGQLWGNPLYRWDRMAADGYKWWVARLKAIFAQVDIVRLDHFRGFMGYFSVPASAPTAQTGEWVRGPGEHFFEAMEAALGQGLPIIAEDLGEITVDVTACRKRFSLPGMAIMQFGFTVAPGQDTMTADPNNPFLPHRHGTDLVVYSGTHDNDTTVGWWQGSSTAEERAFMQTYLATDGASPHWDLIRTCMASPALTAVIPMQDTLGFGTDCRMNFPGRGEGNWGWRLYDHDLSGELAWRLRGQTLLYERCATPPHAALPSPPKQPNY